MNTREVALPKVKVQPRKILGPQEISIERLIALAKKDDLIDFLELPGFREVESVIKRENNGKFKLAAMKEYILGHNELLERFRRSAVAARLYDIYTERLRKMNSEEGLNKQLNQRQVSQMMNAAKRKYVGCIATRTSPEVYEECLYEYNNPDEKYEKYSIVPYNALREQQYQNELEVGNKQRAAILKLSENAKISYLPRGIRQYIDKHPNDFDDYLREIKAEGRYLDAIKRAMRREHDLDARERMRERVLGVIEGEEKNDESFG